MRLRTAILVSLPLCTACATLITGRTDDIEIRSTPTGVKFETNLAHGGVTPMRVTVPDDALLVVRFESPVDGRVHSVEVPPRLSRWIWADVPFGGAFTVLADLMAGGAHTHAAAVDWDARSATHSPVE